MAHAWVEVRYPGYGWIEYDPTTENLAAGEEFRFSSGVPQDLFERLMREILANRSQLNPKEGADTDSPVSVLDAMGRNVRHFLGNYWPFLLTILAAVIFLSIRTGYFVSALLARRPRKKAGLLWAHTLRRLHLAGYKRGSWPGALQKGEAEWARFMEPSFPGIYALYLGIAAARYAPEYTAEDWKTLEERYRLFSIQYAKRTPLYRRILAWFLPPLALALKGTRYLFLVLALLLSLGSDMAHAQTQELELYRDAEEAQQSEYWERAIELYKLGMERYPLDARFPWALGGLYESRRLYGLAWESYRKAEVLIPYDSELLYRMGLTAASLNENASAVEYLERLLAISPDNLDAIGNLAWMYYKLHRLDDGERLLLDTQARFGPSPDCAMTLGTIYSEMFRYDEAKKWYLEAIAGGDATGDRAFSSVAHYNLSLLETRFAHFSEALDRTNAALASQNRASGWLARGELYLHRLDFSRTFADYQEAYEIDNSPLSKINMAQAFQIAGRLEEARLYAEDSLKSRDLSWMINYGIDPDRYKRDLHQILWHTYSGLAETEALSPYVGLRDQLNSFVRLGYYRLKTAVHRHLFRKYSLLSAQAYGGETAAPLAAPGELRLDALIQYFNAFELYPRRAKIYLGMARDFEAPLIPGAANTYDAEMGTLLKDRELLRRTIDAFDPIWERDLLADTYTELALLAKGARSGNEKQDAAERLYALNRGGLRQKGVTLPVHLSFVFNTEDTAAASVRAIKPLVRVLRKAGIRDTGVIDDRANTGDTGTSFGLARFTLTLEMQERKPEGGWNIRCELYDGGRGTSSWQRSIPLTSLTAKDLTAFARTLADTAFTVR
jgi:tetratricopeptide (TPR) repeat protein